MSHIAAKERAILEHALGGKELINITPVSQQVQQLMQPYRYPNDELCKMQGEYREEKIT